MKGVIAFGATGLLALGVATRCAEAQEGMGLAGIHTWVKIAGKTCMADHFHDGQGTGPTKAQAQAAAIRAWTDFTAWEYGRRWAKWQLSVSKSANCSGSRGNISCSVQSRPCTQ
ncbi:MAG: hypothetical protein EHM67_07080 [Hyphomicrobiaceae bacterium]|nr:MAG: hypothetical protein EHM67_07080 [Hyphomicrobiaceae bacterium]